MLAYRCARLLRRADADLETDVIMTVDASGIRGIETADAFTWPDSLSVVELPGLTMPGLVDAHSHLRSAAATAQSHLPGLTFEQWAYALGALTPVSPSVDALVACDEMLQAGITGTQVILHSWGGLQERLAELDAAIAAVERAGLRALIILGFTDQAEYLPSVAGNPSECVPLPERGLPLSEWPAFIAEAVGRIAAASDRVTLGIGPVAPQWCSDTALRMLADLRGDLRVHTHLHESAAQRHWLGDGETPLARLERSGLLGPFTSVAHGVHLTSAELALLAETGTSIVHCPSSNAQLGVGSATVAEWLRAAVEPGLGLDSQALPIADVFAELREAQRTALALGAPLSEEQLLMMATLGGAHAMGSRAGELAIGAPADFIVVDPDVDWGGTQTPVESTVASPAAPTLVGSGDRSWITKVVVDGIQRYPLSAGEAETRMRLNREVAETISGDASARAQRIEALAAPLARIRELSGGVR